jgi:hypothetical protein
MSEDEVKKKALREKYLNDIAQELDVELQRNMKDEKGIIKKTQVLKYIKFDEKGKMLYSAPVVPKTAPNYYVQFEESKILIEYLAGKLVDAEIELCNQKQKTEGLKTQLTKAKEAINGVLKG